MGSHRKLILFNTWCSPLVDRWGVEESCQTWETLVAS
jgi:hypothetical protein